MDLQVSKRHAVTEVTMRRRADPCAAPARAEHARTTAPGRVRASRRLRRVALLCGPAPPSAATAARSAKNICATADAGGLRRSGVAKAAPAPATRRLAAPHERPGLAARALSEMLCDAAQAGRCRATVRQRALPAPRQLQFTTADEYREFLFLKR